MNIKTESAGTKRKHKFLAGSIKLKLTKSYSGWKKKTKLGKKRSDSLYKNKKKGAKGLSMPTKLEKMKLINSLKKMTWETS